MKTLWSTFFLKKFGISPLESGAVFTSWFLRFFYQIGFIISWTILIALFVEQFGISRLPLLFLFDALFVLCASFCSGLVFSRINLASYLKITILGTLLFLCFAFLFSSSQIFFFGALLVAKGIFFSQLNIALYRRTETLFTSSEAQRFFSFIESSITIGALAGALITLFLLSFLDPIFVLSGWALSLCCMFFIVLFTPRWLSFIPRISRSHHAPPPPTPSHILPLLKRFSFLRTLGIILVLQAMVLTFIEIDFTKDVYHHIPSFSDHSIADFSFQEVPLQASVFTEFQEITIDVSQYVHQEISSVPSRLIMHESLAHDLSIFHLLFASVALLFQLFITPQALKRFGIIHTFIAYFAGLFCFVGSFLFGYIPINILRLFQHTTHSLGESSYHISYYSIVHDFRETIRLFFEGMLKPLGIILAILFLLFIPDSFSLWVSLFLLALILFFSSFLKPRFTQISKTNLNHKQDLKEKINAISVLGQKGHMDSVSLLTQELLLKENHSIVRESLVRTLVSLEKPEAVHGFVQLLSRPDESQEMKKFVLSELSRMTIPNSYWEKHAFTGYHLLKILKTIFSETKDIYIKEKVIMNIFRHFPSQESAPFFLENMETANDHLKSIYLRSTRHFQDPEIVFYVRHYLESRSSRLRSHAVIALWSFEDKSFLRQVLYALLHSSDTDAQISALYAFGEVRDFKSIDLIRPFTQSKNRNVQLHALIALAKMEQEDTVEALFDILFGPDIEFAQKAFYMLHRVPKNFHVFLQREIQRSVSLQVSEILKTHDLSKTSSSVFPYLKHLYWLSGRYDDLIALEKI